MTATATITETPSPSQVIAITDIERFVNEQLNMNIESMPKQYESAQRFPHAPINAKPREVAVGGRTVLEVPNLQDVNRGTYYYAWLDADTIRKKPHFRNGFKILHRNDPAAVGKNGELVLPNVWNDRGIIQDGEMFYCWANWDYAHRALKQNYRDIAAKRIAPFVGKEQTQTITRDTDGSEAGRVVTTSINNKPINQSGKSGQKEQ